MALVFSLFVTLAAFAANTSHPDPEWKGSWKGLPQLLVLLETVPEGKTILDSARKKDPNFLDHVHAGDASYTESTFARTYSLLDGKENIELKHEVMISKHLTLGEAVVDLAHELVHFTEKEMLDPYKPGFELEEFVRRGIEGQGGELTALTHECLVAWSLKRHYTRYPEHSLCAAYRTKSGAFDTEKALDDYYALGNWRAPPALAKAIPDLTGDPVVFTSSYARKPYPIALAEEFESTQQTACANNRKKYRLISSAQTATSRAPASEQLLSKESRRLKNYDRIHCRPDKK